MKSYILAITLTISIFISSCLKQSIPEAMLEDQNAGKITASFSFKVNGTPVSLTINDIDNQSSVPYRRLSFEKKPGSYNLQADISEAPVFVTFFTDSLTTGNYKFTSANGDLMIMYYNGRPKYIHAPGDSMSFNITSYTNGHISGNFAGALTPWESGDFPLYVFGTPGSVHVTNGVFENIPVIY